MTIRKFLTSVAGSKLQRIAVEIHFQGRGVGRKKIGGLSHLNVEIA
jgi:hypothetical protein